VPCTELRLPRKCDVVVFYRYMKVRDTEVWETEMGPISKHVIELSPFDESWHK